MAARTISWGYFDLLRPNKEVAHTPGNTLPPSSSTSFSIADSVFDRPSVSRSSSQTSISTFQTGVSSISSQGEVGQKISIAYNLHTTQEAERHQDASAETASVDRHGKDAVSDDTLERPASVHLPSESVNDAQINAGKPAIILVTAPSLASRAGTPEAITDQLPGPILTTKAHELPVPSAPTTSTVITKPAIVLVTRPSPVARPGTPDAGDVLPSAVLTTDVRDSCPIVVPTAPTIAADTVPAVLTLESPSISVTRNPLDLHGDGPVMLPRDAPAIPAVNSPTIEAVFVDAAEHQRDLILPVPLANPQGFQRDPEKEMLKEEDRARDDAAQVADLEKQGNQASHSKPATQDGIFHRMWNSYRRAYCPKEDPQLIMPSGPTDTEKYCYLRTNRLGLYFFGVISFGSLSAGMWLFVLSSKIFSWFGVFFALLQIYLLISYAVSICGKDFDFEAHKKILADHPIDPLTCPTVDIYLPCCKEPIEVLENTYKHVQQLQWPAEKLQVHVMDDGAMESVKTLAEKYGFNYLCRDDRPRLKKAGNLRWTFARTSGDFFTIYDADFCPRSDFLLEIIPQHLADDKTAIVQTPQFFRVSDEQTWVEQGAGAVQELFYRVVQVNRTRWGAAICVGSNAVYRRAALEEVGGTAEIGFSEDVHTGFGAVDRGWKVKYLPLCLACGICPDTPRAFFSQQMRWCMGSTTLLTNPEFWTSRLSLVQKVCYLCGMMYYSAMALSIFISPIPGIFLLWLRPEFFKYYNLAFAIPSLLYGLLTFRVWAKASYGVNVQFIMQIQSYAYLTAIKDRLFGRALAWVPSGDNKAHKNNKYRNMRLLCAGWQITLTGFLVGGVTYRILLGMHWWNCLPLILLHTFNLFLVHRFLLYSG